MGEILDWQCPGCGRTGTAVAVGSDKEPRVRVKLSHDAQVRYEKGVRCSGEGLFWNVRPLRLPR